MGAKHKKHIFSTNARSWAENDSNTIFTKKSYLYFDIADSQNGQNMTKYPYSNLGFSGF